MIKRGLYSAACVLLLSFLTACSASFTEVNVKPTSAPVFNMTRSSQVLACVGNQIDSRGGAPIDIFISDISDHTTPSIESGFLTKNAVMMVTTAVDRLSTGRVQIIGRTGADPSRRQVQLIGAFTELNRTSSSNALNSKSSFPAGLGLSLGGDQSFNHIALDMALSEGSRLIPLTSTSVSIQVHTKSGTTTLTYDDGGDFAAVAALGFSAQEGFHSAQRLLIETAVALMISRYYQIDIATCLQRAHPQDNLRNLDQPIFLDGQIKRENAIPNILSAPGRRERTEPTSTALYGSDTPVDNVLPVAESEDVVILPRGNKKNKYLEEQPSEFRNRQNTGYSGSYTSTPSNGGMITPPPQEKDNPFAWE